MRPSVVLDMKRGAVREAVGRFRTANPRVFGSVLHGTDRDGSDLDLLVDALPGATLLDLGDLEEELKSLLGVDVDLLTPGDLPPKFRAKVLAAAQPIGARTACPITSTPFSRPQPIGAASWKGWPRTTSWPTSAPSRPSS